MNKPDQFLDFFNEEYQDPKTHPGYSTNSELRFDSRADALTIKHLLEEQSPYAKYYQLSAEYINPNQSMQVGWYLTVKKLPQANSAPKLDSDSSSDQSDKSDQS